MRRGLATRHACSFDANARLASLCASLFSSCPRATTPESRCLLHTTPCVLRSGSALLLAHATLYFRVRLAVVALCSPAAMCSGWRARTVERARSSLACKVQRIPHRLFIPQCVSPLSLNLHPLTVFSFRRETNSRAKIARSVAPVRYRYVRARPNDRSWPGLWALSRWNRAVLRGNWDK